MARASTGFKPKNVPGWVEDANSPFTGSGADTHTYTVAGNHDKLLVMVDCEATTNGRYIQVNGDTGTNYNYVDNSNTTTTGATRWNLGSFLDLAKVTAFEFSEIGVGIGLSVIDASGYAGNLISGRNQNVTSPITQFTVSEGGGTTFDITAKVYGWSQP